VKHPDDPIELVAALARERELEDDPRWEALADGTLSDADRAELEAQALRSEAGRLAWKAMQPFSPEEDGAMLDRLAAMVAASPKDAPPREPSPGTTAPAPVVRLHSRRRMRLALAVAAPLLAAAAGLLLALRPPAFAPLPDYQVDQVEALGGAAERRSGAEASDEPIHLAPGTSLHLRLLPFTEAKGPLAVRAALVRDGRAEAWRAPATFEPNGIVEVVAPRDTAFAGVAGGAWELVVAVGRPDALPSTPEGLVRPPPNRDVKVVRVKLALDVDQAPPLRVELGGCRAVARGPVCEIDGPAVVRFSVAGSGDLSVRLDGAPAPAPITASRGYRSFRMDLPADAGEVVIAPAAAAAEWASPFVLAVALRPADPHLREAEALRRRGQLQEAEAELAALAGDERPMIRAQVTGKRGRIARSRGRVDEAVRLLRLAVQLDGEAGRVSEEVDDRLVLAFTFTSTGRYAEAREALDGIEALDAAYPTGRVLAAYHRCLAKNALGDLRAALRLCTEADDGAQRLGLQAERTGPRALQAYLFSSLGRIAEASKQYDDLLADLARGENRCDEAKVRNDVGWFALQSAATAGGVAPPSRDPIAILEDALALHREACPEPVSLANLLTNLALAELQGGRVDAARGHLLEARAADPSAPVRVSIYWDEIEARLALGAGHAAEALRSYDRMAQRAGDALLPEATELAAVGRADALAALGRTAAARAAYAAADALLDSRIAVVPLGESRSTFFARHERSTRRRIDFLLGLADAARPGSPEAEAARREALEAARRARARVLVASQWADRPGALPAATRARWESAVDAYRGERAALEQDVAEDGPRLGKALQEARAAREQRAEQARVKLDAALEGIVPASADLPPLGDGEVLLAYYPVTKGWVGFALTAGGVTAKRLDPVDPDAPPSTLTARLLEPFRAEIVSSRRIRLAPYGSLQRVDFHALPWDGAPLVAHAPVVYGLDLRPAAPGVAPRGALVVVNAGNLSSARDEASAVVAALGTAGLAVERLEGAQVTHATLRAAFERPDLGLLHYIGHGARDGGDVLAGGLPLAVNGKTTGGRLTVGDVLTLSRVPPRVVLSACETAAAGDAGPVSLGLAQAFVTAGARSVLAATRTVGDAHAARIMRDLYRASPDDAASLRDVQRQVAGEMPLAEWSAFRVLVP
jgi:tetratricopeptide (TPR) repeat protein